MWCSIVDDGMCAGPGRRPRSYGGSVAAEVVLGVVFRKGGRYVKGEGNL